MHHLLRGKDNQERWQQRMIDIFNEEDSSVIQKIEGLHERKSWNPTSGGGILYSLFFLCISIIWNPTKSLIQWNPSKYMTFLISIDYELFKSLLDPSRLHLDFDALTASWFQSLLKSSFIILVDCSMILKSLKILPNRNLTTPNKGFNMLLKKHF